MSNGQDKKEDFWELGDFRKKTREIAQRASQTGNLSAQDIEYITQTTTDIANKAVKEYQETQRSHYEAVYVNVHTASDSQGSAAFSDSSITKFIPPHSDPAFKKKHVICEYEPSNPFIKSVRFLSEKEGDKLFLSDNLFMRERAALLNRTVAEATYAPFYSYAPRYSQLTKPQLRYYLWWRENVRNGIFPKTDESYIMLYAYELAATGEDEDKTRALSLLCSLLTAYPIRQLNMMMKTMIRDIICDFCLVHKLTPPLDKLVGIERQIINNSFLPEMFVDLNFDSQDKLPDTVSTSMSLYDYKKSKYYVDNSELFDKAITGAFGAVMRDKAAFEAITSFTRGVYGAVTSERHPFNRMVNIVNKNVSVEVTYFELSNVRPAITDIVRYSENKLREHLGIKNKISIMSINPMAKSVMDNFFEEHYPPRPAVDRRRKDAHIDEREVHEYDKLYDLPRTEISPERALEIEQQSWNTTKILTEAFTDESPEAIKDINEAVTTIAPTTIQESILDTSACSSTEQNVGGLYEQICSQVGGIGELIRLCTNGATAADQRRFATSHSTSLDEIADLINEAAANILGDIILESDGVSYVIVDDYKHLFGNL